MNRSRLLRACLTVTLCLAVGACGGDSPDSEVEPPQAGAGKDSGLGEKRFTALDAVFTAAVPFDRYEKPEDFAPRRYRRDARPLMKACEALPDDDALMRALRRGCPLITDVVEQTNAFGLCESPTTCLRGARGFRRVVKRTLAVSRRTDRAVARAKELSDDCKAALTTPPKTYPVFKAYDSAIGLLERSLRSPSPAALEKAQKSLAAADRRSKALPTGRENLERFRRGCD